MDTYTVMFRKFEWWILEIRVVWTVLFLVGKPIRAMDQLNIEEGMRKHAENTESSEESYKNDIILFKFPTLFLIKIVYIFTEIQKKI